MPFLDSNIDYFSRLTEDDEQGCHTIPGPTQLKSDSAHVDCNGQMINHATRNGFLNLSESTLNSSKHITSDIIIRNRKSSKDGPCYITQSHPTHYIKHPSALLANDKVCHSLQPICNGGCRTRSNLTLTHVVTDRPDRCAQYQNINTPSISDVEFDTSMPTGREGFFLNSMARNNQQRFKTRHYSIGSKSNSYMHSNDQPNNPNFVPTSHHSLSNVPSSNFRFDNPFPCDSDLTYPSPENHHVPQTNCGGVTKFVERDSSNSSLSLSRSPGSTSKACKADIKKPYVIYADTYTTNYQEIDNELTVNTESDKLVSNNRTNEIKHFHRIALKKIYDVIVFLLSNPLFCIFILLFIFSSSASLFWYTCFRQEPRIHIDKTYDSFKIPHHLIWRQYDALIEATKQVIRAKRSTSEHITVEKFKQYFEAKKSERNMNKLGGAFQNIPDYTQQFSNSLEGITLAPFASDFRNNLRILRSANAERVNRNTIPKIIRAIPQYRRYTKLQLFYIAKDNGNGDKNIFTPSRLKEIHKIERMIANRTGFEKVCYINQKLLFEYWSNGNQCEPVNSLLAYFYPSFKKGSPVYDGRGAKLTDDIDKTIVSAINNDPSLFWYVDDDMNSTNRRSTLLRSEVSFGWPLSGILQIYVMHYI